MKTIQEFRQQLEPMMRTHGVRSMAAGATPEGMEVSYYTGYSDGRLYGWDLYFEGIVQLHAGWNTDLIRNGLCLFLDQVDRDGFIPRTLPAVWWGNFHQQPFLCQTALLLARAGDSLAWLFPRRYYALKHYLLRWLESEDRRGSGLSVWDHSGQTGMDNHFERAGTFHDAFCEGVDLNAYLVRECEAMALLAEINGAFTAGEATVFRRWAQLRREAVNRWCWDDKSGQYLDYHAHEKRLIPVRYVGMFAALWAGIPTMEQADRLVHSHLRSPSGFWRPYPLPALAADEPGYTEGFLSYEPENYGCSWRAHSWMPANYIAFQGLRRYGFVEVAEELAKKNFRMFQQSPFCEYYGSETGTGMGRHPFWGWSALALFMESELALTSDPTLLCREPFRRCG